MKANFTTFIGFIMLIVLLVTNIAEAQKLPFQGKLLENGAPVNGPRTFAFSIAGTTWTETHSNIAVNDGLYFVLLGSINPLPTNLFEASDTRQLNVTVGGQSLSPVQIFAPLNGAERRSFAFTENDEPVLDQNGQPVAYHYTINYDLPEGPNFRGLQMDIFGNGRRFGSRTNIFTNTGDVGNKIALFGSATGEGEGDHTAVFGQAFGKGKFNTGISGTAGGEGNGLGADGFNLNGSYNNGVTGRALNNLHGNTGVFGHASGATGYDNIGVVGWSEVTSGQENKGVLGWAKGPAVNKGIVGLATGGTENWAGWFEGDVRITGQLVYDGNLEVAFPEVITKNVETEGGTVGALTLVAEGNGGGASAGLITSSSALNGSNSGVRSTVTSVSSNTANHYGYLANVTHGGTGQAAGLWANMFGDGTGNKIGVRTAVSGNNSAINYGVRAINSAVTTDGGSNWGGLFTVTGTGVANSTNIGLDANVTKDNGTNIGVRGSASGGTENWAGWFDGDVKITGNLVYEGNLQVESTLPDTVYAYMDSGEPVQTGLTIMANGPGTSENVAFSAVAKAESGVNTAIWAKSEGKEGSDSFVYGIYSETSSFGTGFNTPIQGVGSGTGSGSRYGIRGDVSGSNSTFPVAVRGRNSAIPNANGFIWGANFTAVAPEGIDPTSTSIGVQADAVSPGGTNIGVRGLAANGLYNWAGWFEGDVKVTGNLSVDGQGGSISATTIRQDYGNFGKKDWEDIVGLQGFLDLRGDAPEGKDNIRVGLDVSRDGEETFGNFNLFGPVYNDPNCTICPRNFVSARVEKRENNQVSGRLDLAGPTSPNFSFEGKGWDNSDLPMLQMFGSQKNPEDWFYNRVVLEVNRDGDNEFGQINFSNSDGGQSRLSSFELVIGDPFNENVDGVYLNEEGRISSKTLDVKNTIHLGNIFQEGSSGVFINNTQWTDESNNPTVRLGETILKSTDGRQIQINPYAISGSFNVNTAANGNYVNIDPAQGMMDMSKANLTSAYGSAGQGALTLFDGAINERINLAVQDFEGRYWGNLYMSNSTSGAHVNISGDGFINLNNGEGNQTIFLNGGNGQIDAIALNQTSDARLKTNILPLNNALSNVMRMRGVSYNWIDKSKSEQLQIGVIAQEVEAIYPEFVHTNDEGMKSVNYSQMVAVLIEAIKELNTKVGTLEAANAKLTATVAAISSENTTLKASLSDVDSLKQQMKTLQSLVAKLVSNEGVTTSTTTTEQR